MKKILVILCLLCLVLTAFRRVSRVQPLIPKGWPAPLYDYKKNPLSAEKVLLGRVLFYDPILSADSTISCFSCHSPYTAFTHADHALSHGIEGKIGTRNSPALMNLAWAPSFMWDGAIAHLEKQPLFPIAQPNEMGEKVEHVLEKLQRSARYRSLFYTAFGDSMVTDKHLTEAIAQFMLTLISAESRYDSMIRKQVMYTPQEAHGYRLFQQHCAACHTEPLFTNHKFENNGLPVDTTIRDLGRMGITGLSSDSLRFKVPTLRNVEYSFPYMHDGRFKKLYDVLKHYTAGIQHSASLAPQLQQPIVLSADDRVDLVAFLLTLTDRRFLFNPDFAYPKNIFITPTQE